MAELTEKDKDTLIEELRDTPKVQDAIKKLIAAYPEKDVIDMETKEQKIQLSLIHI